MQNGSYLEHYGIKGMKWGVRRTPEQLGHRPGNFKKNRQLSPDKARKADMRNAVKNRRNLSDKELKDRIDRLKMEKQLRELTDQEINSGRNYVQDIIKQSGKKVATTVLAGATLYAIKTAMDKNFDWKEAAKYVAPKPKNK